MEGSVNKGFPLTSSTTPSLSGESNENEVNFDESNSKLHQPKKPLTKHFMAPTISAATKAAAATVIRKKILTDRNESSNFFDTHLQKTPNLLESSNFFDTHLQKTSNLLESSMTSQIKPPSKFVRSSSFRLASSHNSDDEDQNDSSLKPYDPVSSYTSPRPKFLRYNPNRRQHPLNETCKEDVKLEARTRMCFDSQMGDDALNSEVSSSQESPRKEEETEFDDKSNGDQEIVDHEEEEEEEEEEIEEIEEERGLSLKNMLKFVLIVVALFFSTLYIVSMNSSNPSPTIEALQGLKNGYYGIQNKVFEVVNRKIFEGINEPFSLEVERNADAELEERRIEDENRGMRGGNPELGEVVEVENVQTDHELKSKVEGFDLLEGNGLGEFNEGAHRDEEIEKIEAGSNELLETETAERFKFFQDHHVIIGEEVVEGVFRDEEIKKSGEESDELLEIETAERFKSFQDHQVIRDEEIKKSDEESDEFLEIETAERFKFKSFQDHQVIGEEEVKVEEIAINSLAESDLKETVINKLAVIKSIPKCIIGVTMSIFTILASLGVYLLKHKKTPSKDYPQLEKEPITESCETQYQKAHSMVEKISPVLDVEHAKIKKIEFKAKPSALIRSNEEEEKETSTQFSLSQAPIVELLSELVIGEVEESKITASSSLVEFSAVDSPSYGSFTPKKKISKKEEAKDGEMNMLITPVRRSSRIRNRAVMSP